MLERFFIPLNKKVQDTLRASVEAGFSQRREKMEDPHPYYYRRQKEGRDYPQSTFAK